MALRIQPTLTRFGLLTAVSLGLLLPASTAQAQVDPVAATNFLQTAAQYAAEKAQWITDNLIKSAGNATHIGAQQLAAEQNTRGQQAQIDAAAIETQKKIVTKLSLDSVMLMPGDAGTTTNGVSGNNLCALAMETASIRDGEGAKSTLERAITNVLRTSGQGANNPNVAAQQLSMLGCYGVADSSQTPALKNMNCQSGAADGSATTPSTIFEKLEYTFPSNLSANSKGTATIGQPSGANDQAGMAPIALCMIAAPATGQPSNSTTYNPSDASVIMAQLRDQWKSNATSGSCVSMAAERYAVPSSASGNMAQVHAAQERTCLYMYQNGKLSQTDYQNCQKNGMSALNARMHVACAGANPTYVQTQATRGMDVDSVTKEMSGSSEKCRAFYEEKQRKEQAFIQSMQMAQDTNVTEKGSTQR